VSPDETGWKIFDYAWALVGGLLMIVWNMLNGKINENSRALHARIKETNSEVDRQRDNVAKVFDRIEELGRSSAERDARRSEEFHHMHTQLLDAIHHGLSQKADK
jgi:hypothetical protein